MATIMYPKNLKFKKVFQSILLHFFVALTCLNLPLETLNAEEIEMDSISSSPQLNCLQDARIEVGYAGGKFIGIERDYAEYGLFIPTYFNQSTLFVDGRAYQFRNNHHHYHAKWSSSVGVGFRVSDCWDRILGLNVYYDFLGKRHTHHSHTQVGAFLSIPFDALCNLGCFTEYCQNLCIQPVGRNGIIFPDRRCCSKQNW